MAWDNEARREWYKKNKDKERARLKKSNKASQQKLQKWWKEYKSTLSCELCPENDPVCLDFHHKDPGTKDITLANAVHMGWGRGRIMKEVDKCMAVCANCHRKIHANMPQ
jgi:hypothetical protein